MHPRLMPRLGGAGWRVDAQVGFVKDSTMTQERVSLANRRERNGNEFGFLPLVVDDRDLRALLDSSTDKLLRSDVPLFDIQQKVTVSETRKTRNEERKSSALEIEKSRLSPHGKLLCYEEVLAERGPWEEAFEDVLRSLEVDTMSVRRENELLAEYVALQSKVDQLSFEKDSLTLEVIALKSQLKREQARSRSFADRFATQESMVAKHMRSFAADVLVAKQEASVTYQEMSKMLSPWHGAALPGPVLSPHAVHISATSPCPPDRKPNVCSRRGDGARSLHASLHPPYPPSQPKSVLNVNRILEVFNISPSDAPHAGNGGHGSGKHSRSAEQHARLSHAGTAATEAPRTGQGQQDQSVVHAPESATTAGGRAERARPSYVNPSCTNARFAQAIEISSGEHFMNFEGRPKHRLQDSVLAHGESRQVADKGLIDSSNVREVCIPGLQEL